MAKLKESMELGELYKELRMARGLRQKDITNSNLSTAQLSKFENGQSMLSADKLLIAISGIHMSFAEFGHVLNHYEESEFFKLGNKIAELHSKQDIEGLKYLLEEYKDYETFDVYNRLNLLVIKNSIYSLDNSYIVNEDDKEFLATYLYGIEAWTEYELYLFCNTMELLSNEDLIFLSKTFIERDKLYQSIPTHQNVAKMTFLNLISAMIERDQCFYGTYFIEKLEARLTYQDTLVFLTLKFLKLLMEFRQSKGEHIDDVTKYISMIDMVGLTVLAEIFRAQLNKFIE
ncbi:helix-turn-helix domain-containing protein [Streptococcus macacae]|uniref:DNA-binding helix-turn-helix protein n=1 Tax=Streptococcus macacae NCTC 11558 TaxID=764298 RepID=G5JUG1_9STRE|nr:Rgg/GadR/MutR family transcriptional regulator [Streptococcus macacae]EHJ52005.1 DNA-binding helix-turn-helix protein [Streptococcus macacae NCTC 11558]SUN78603.1 MutR family transcriptional regulator [Streptococcus macacae NCTC 11558]